MFLRELRGGAIVVWRSVFGFNPSADRLLQLSICGGPIR